MIDIYQGCYFDGVFLKSDTEIADAVIYNVSNGKAHSLNPQVREDEEYVYDVVLKAKETATLECGVYHLEVLDADGRMIDHKDNQFRVLPSSNSGGY